MLPDFSTIHAPTQLDLDPLSWGKLNPTLTHLVKLQEVLYKEVRAYEQGSKHSGASCKKGCNPRT